MNRYESVLRGNRTMSATLLSEEPLTKGSVVKIRGSEYTVMVILPADDQRPHLGDTILKTKPKPKKK